MGQSSKVHFKIIRVIFQSILALTIFSFWAGFALLIVNRYFYNDLPGYTKGRICEWEIVAIILSVIISHIIIKKWGEMKVEKIGHKTKLTMDPKYGVYFSFYFLIALLVGIWQFYLFSQNF
jgi:hypothetical protein